MKRNGGFGIGLLGCLVGGIAGSCVGGASLVGPPSAPDDVFIVVDAPVLRTLPVTDFLVPPDLTGLDDEILSSPMLRNPEFRAEVDEWIEFWRTRSSRWFPSYLERMAWFEETVDSALAARDLPPSLRYLPVIESGYSPGAVSVASAVGLWQFMAPTARGFGMEINPLVDERRDPYKSTAAAVRFLATLRQDFGSWFLALAAYNSGPARVERVLQRYAPLAPGSDSLYWALRRHLPKETQDFVPKLLGAIVVAGSPASHGYTAVESGGFDFEQVMIPDATTLDVVARAAESTESEIARLNPEYVRGMTPPGRRVLVRVPAGMGSTFQRNYARIPRDERVSFLEHQVSAGETLGHIAREYGVPLADLRAANPLVRPRRLRIGALITVPVSPSVRRGSAPAS
ncbi:MAG: transglycosylase SLT domain-containing protein [Gemmatimonadota bacterium]|nr:transglycosylase SLT domain-containing protein [Gemmatimonadota bacterium]